MDEIASEIMKIPNTTPVRARTWYKPVLLVISVVAFGTLCFGLGRLSRIEENKPDLIVEAEQTAQVSQTFQTSSQTTQTKQASQTSGGVSTSKGTYVASKMWPVRTALNTTSPTAREFRELTRQIKFGSPLRLKLNHVGLPPPPTVRACSLIGGCG